ncbi:MAG TPA: alpha/beta hydrolase, partial [Ureibacillus sp.]|nr:alpha/beta hydrolase [Ureibacillus sp.]
VSKRIPNCKLVTIEGAGHEVHAGNLSAFLTAVKSFLDS